MPEESKPQDCHYYEPDIKDFDGCPSPEKPERLDVLVCKECHHRAPNHQNSKGISII